MILAFWAKSWLGLRQTLKLLAAQSNGEQCSLYASDLPYVGPDPPADVHRGELAPTRTRSGVMDSLLRSSLLRFSPPIPGVNYPMIYIGSRNTFFCWHVEDNLLYATNYVQAGAPKCWYAVPPGAMEDMEAAWRSIFPSLFTRHPDMQYWKTCIFSPMALQASGIPVYRATAEAGSFIFTLPGAYHCGFNVGFNVAESTNFAFSPWVPTGVFALQRYRTPITRDSTLLHDGLICSVLKYGNSREVKQLICEARRMLEEEREARNRLQDAGVQVPVEGSASLETDSFDILQAEKDEWRCRICRHLCYFSVVVCRCVPAFYLCPRHGLHKPAEGDAEPSSYIHLDDNPDVINLNPIRSPRAPTERKETAEICPSSGRITMRFECHLCGKKLKASIPNTAKKVSTKCVSCNSAIVMVTPPTLSTATSTEHSTQDRPPDQSTSTKAPCQCAPSQRRLKVRHPLAQIEALMVEARERVAMAESAICAADEGTCRCFLNDSGKPVSMAQLWPNK